jgi:hypothetical protein
MRRSYFILVILACALSCKKTSTTGNNSTGNNDSSAAVTAIGTPMGDPVTKTIGAAGGTIISADGREELNIPAGALTSDLAITIQPITNECPNGVGIAYDFLPNGTKFLIPATLTFHYTDDDVNGTDPDLINLAFQDSLQEWEVDIFKDVDTVAKTIIYDVSHFTPRAHTAAVTVKQDPKLSSLSSTTLTENQQAFLIVSQGTTRAQYTGDPDPALAWTLPKPTQVSNDIVSNWTLTAGSLNGSLSNTTGSNNTYTAPNSIPVAKTVTVTATVAIQAVSVGRNKQKSKVSTAYRSLSIRLKLIPRDLSFSIKVIYDDPEISGSEFQQAYHDEATFEVDVKNNLVTIPTDKIQNQSPTVVPTSKVAGGDSSSWNSDPIGIINIVGGIGFIVADPATNQRNIVMTISSANTLQPSFTLTNIPTKVSSTDGGTPTQGYPESFTFIYQDKDTVIDPLIGTQFAGMQTITVTSIPVPTH